jgi:hypothetical protein
MKKLVHDLLTTKYTEVYHEEPEEMKYNAPHHFVVVQTGEKPEPGIPEINIANIDFQEGPCKEFGVNGVANEDLIAMVICRLEHFQRTAYACRENAVAITKLEEALLWLRKRTIGRENTGKDGTSKV